MIRSVGDTLPPFALYDQDGEVLTTDYFDGSVTVLNFIFTRCSIAEMCPASTMRMKKLQTLASQTKVPHVKFLSITLDPEFDTPGVLKSYARAYDLNEQNFRLGTATKAAIDDLNRQFGIFRKNVEDLPLDHTMRTMIINSKRQIIYQFPGSHWAAEDFLARLPEGFEG
jgi:protein SCO1/2